MNDLEGNYEYSSTGYSVSEPIRYFSLSLVDPNKIRLINVGPDLVRLIQERLAQLVSIDNTGYVILGDYIHSHFHGRFNIYDLILVKNYFQKDGDISKEDMTIIKVAFCRILGALFCFGYDMVISSNLAREGTHSTIFFKLRDSSDYFYSLNYLSHKFICIAPYSTESILLINIPKVSVEEILKIIHLTWSPGIKSKQTLADDERSVTVVIALRLCGHPWTQATYASGKSTIQARSVILEIIQSLSAHKWRFAANINTSGHSDSLFFQWCPYLDLEGDRYCALLLSRYDRLRLLQVPESLSASIKEAIQANWYLGLQKTRDYHGSTEFKLGGTPWWSEGNDAVEARFFMSTLLGVLQGQAWEVAGTFDLSRAGHDKSTFLLKHVRPSLVAHCCISFCKSNRIRLIVSSSTISEASELALTSRLNETIKRSWVSLGPRNFGKSIEWKLEGEPWECEGLYLDQSRAYYLLCLLLEAINPLGWRLIASADVSSKNMDGNDRGYSLVGKPEDVHTWFFLYDPKLIKEDGKQAGHALHNSQQQQQQQSDHHHLYYMPPQGHNSNNSSAAPANSSSKHTHHFDYMPASNSVPNLESLPCKGPLPQAPERCSTASSLPFGGHGGGGFLTPAMHLSRSVPSVASMEEPGGHFYEAPGYGIPPGYPHQHQQHHHHSGFESFHSARLNRSSNLSLSAHETTPWIWKAPYTAQGHTPHRHSCSLKKRAAFLRQNSAGSLPNAGSHPYLEDGYKSDGEACYRSEAGGPYRQRAAYEDEEDEEEEEEDELEEEVDVGGYRRRASAEYLACYGASESHKRVSRCGKYGYRSPPGTHDTVGGNNNNGGVSKASGEEDNGPKEAGASSSEELFAIQVRETTVTTHSRSKGLLPGSGSSSKASDEDKGGQAQGQQSQPPPGGGCFVVPSSSSNSCGIGGIRHRSACLRGDPRGRLYNGSHCYSNTPCAAMPPIRNHSSIQNYLSGGQAPPPPCNIESASTQSSSSSASAPPDYATLNGGHSPSSGGGGGVSGYPPHTQQHPAGSSSRSRKNNELYYVGEFYG